MVEKNIKHVVQCKPDGSVEMTLKDKDFRPFKGYRTIKRMSEILFNEGIQKFYIKFRTSDSGETQTPPMFDTYEEAVDYEIRFINSLRKKGFTFDDKLEKSS